MATSLIVAMVSSLIQFVALKNAINGKGVMRAEKGQEGGFLPLLTLSLMAKVMSGKGGTKAGRGYNNIVHMDGNV